MKERTILIALRKVVTVTARKAPNCLTKLRTIYKLIDLNLDLMKEMIPDLDPEVASQREDEGIAVGVFGIV